VKNRRHKKSLTEAFGYKERIHQLSLNELRNLIKTELLFEEEEADKKKPPAGDDAISKAPEHFKAPAMTDTPADGTGSIGDLPAEEIVAQMLSGDPKAPVVVAISAFHNTEFTPDFATSVGSKEGAKDLQQWTMEKGPAFIANNIATVQNALGDGAPAADFESGPAEPAMASPDIALGDAVLPTAEPTAAWFENQESIETKKETISRVTLQLLEDSHPKEDDPVGPSAQTEDPKDLALAFLAKGLQDSVEGGGGIIDVSEDESINVAEMVPTQQDVHLGKSLAFALAGGFGPEDTGAYVTDANEILDGHYRWSGTMIVDPGAAIKGQKISAPAEDVLPALTALGDAFSNNSSNKAKKNESTHTHDDLIVERWQKLAGILKD
jgi:hypothetical protein